MAEVASTSIPPMEEDNTVSKRNER